MYFNFVPGDAFIEASKKALEEGRKKVQEEKKSKSTKFVVTKEMVDAANKLKREQEAKQIQDAYGTKEDQKPTQTIIKKNPDGTKTKVTISGRKKTDAEEEAEAKQIQDAYGTKEDQKPTERIIRRDSRGRLTETIKTPTGTKTRPIVDETKTEAERIEEAYGYSNQQKQTKTIITPTGTKKYMYNPDADDDKTEAEKIEEAYGTPQEQRPSWMIITPTGTKKYMYDPYSDKTEAQQIEEAYMAGLDMTGYFTGPGTPDVGDTGDKTPGAGTVDKHGNRVPVPGGYTGPGTPNVGDTGPTTPGSGLLDEDGNYKVDPEYLSDPFLDPLIAYEKATKNLPYEGKFTGPGTPNVGDTGPTTPGAGLIDEDGNRKPQIGDFTGPGTPNVGDTGPTTPGGGTVVTPPGGGGGGGGGSGSGGGGGGGGAPGGKGGIPTDPSERAPGERTIGSHEPEESPFTEADVAEIAALLYFIPDRASLNPDWGNDKISSIRGGLARGWTGQQIAKWWTTMVAPEKFQGFLPSRWTTVGDYLKSRDSINQLLDDRGLGDQVFDVEYGYEQSDDPVGKLLEEGFDSQDIVNRLDQYFKIINSPDAKHLYNAVYIGSGQRLTAAQLVEIQNRTPLGDEIVSAYQALPAVDSVTALDRAAELVTYDLSEQLGGVNKSRLLDAHNDPDTAKRLLAAFLDRDMSLTDAVDVTEEVLVQMAAFGQGVADLSNDDLDRLAALGASRTEGALARTRAGFGEFTRNRAGVQSELGRLGVEQIDVGGYVESEVFGSGDATGALEYLRQREGSKAGSSAFGTSVDSRTSRFVQRGRRAV